MGLPEVVLCEEATCAVDVTAGRPLQHELGPADGITVEKVGKAPGPPEPGGSLGEHGEREEAVVIAPSVQHIEHRPDERVDVPRIGLPGAPGLEHDMAQAAGEAEFDVCRHTITGAGPGRAQGTGQLECQPAAHGHRRHCDPLGRHGVFERLSQQFGQRRRQRPDPAGTA
jgi:hypothetical protein